jgi:uncharacterized membrane protein YcaP (DUF421 family)
MLRLTGKRAFGEMSPFDIVVLVLVGGALRSAMVGRDASLLGPFIAVAAILVIDKALAWIAARSPVVDRLMEGRAVLLAKGAKLVPNALRRHGISPAAFDRELRSHEHGSLDGVREARLEANGRITVLSEEEDSK